MQHYKHGWGAMSNANANYVLDSIDTAYVTANISTVYMYRETEVYFVDIDL